MIDHALTAARPDIKKETAQSNLNKEIEMTEETTGTNRERSPVTTATKLVIFQETVKKRENQETQATTETKVTTETQATQEDRDKDKEMDRETMVKVSDVTTVRSLVTCLRSVPRRDKRDSQDRSLSVTTVEEWVIWLELVPSKRINFS